MAFSESQTQTTTSNHTPEFAVATKQEITTAVELRKRLSEVTYTDEEWENGGLSDFEDLLARYFNAAADEIRTSYTPSVDDEYTRRVTQDFSNRADDIELHSLNIRGFAYEDLAELGILKRWLETIENSNPNAGINRYRAYLEEMKVFLNPGKKEKYFSQNK